MKATLLVFAPALAVAGWALFAPAPTQGGIYRVDFSGYTTTFDDDPHSPQAPAPGTPLSGYYIYDSNAAPTQTSPTRNIFDFASPYGMHVQEGNLIFDSNVVPGLTQIYVRKGQTEDQFFVDSYSSLIDATTNQVVFPYAEAFLGFRDPSKSSLPADLSLPTTAFDPSKLNIELFLAGAATAAGVEGPNGFGLNGVVTSMTIVQLSSAGFSQTDPALPVITEQGTFKFEDVVSGQWFDPPITSGFHYEMTSGSLFTHILGFPTGFANPFSIYADGSLLGVFGPGDAVDFTSLPGGGTSSFDVFGINPSVDAALPDAFPLQLAFNSVTASFTMTPIPEPSSLVLVGSALLLGSGCALRRRAA